MDFRPSKNDEIVVVIGRDGSMEWWACDPIWKDNAYVASRLQQASELIQTNGSGSPMERNGEGQWHVTSTD